MLFGDLPIEAWPQPDSSSDAEPWLSFIRARELDHAGRRDDAVAVWREIAAHYEYESRHNLQAWYFLRSAGVAPPPNEAATVQAAVAEVAVGAGHDLLISYRVGGVRYLNHAGPAAVVEPDVYPSVDAAATVWRDVAASVARVVGVWDKPELPPLPPGHSRVMMLTPAGPRFGQGPDQLLRKDAPAAAFLATATRVLRAIPNPG